MPISRTPPAHEPGPQPDPMLEPGRRSTGWVWLIALAALVVVAGTLYGLNNQDEQTTASQSAPPQTSGPSEAPKTAMPAGRTTGAAPREQQPAKTDGNQAAPQPPPANQGGQQNGNAGNKQ